MINITPAEASINILTFADEGRLTQSKWHGHSADGRDIACLLGAIHPSVTSAAQCNGDLMPMWLAELTPVLFDGISTDQVVPIARRYGALIARWDRLSTVQWDSILTRVLIRCIDEAVAAAEPICRDEEFWPAVAAACEQSKAAINSGDKTARAASAYASADATVYAAACAISAARVTSAASASASADATVYAAAYATRAATSAAYAAASAAASAAYASALFAYAANAAAYAASFSLFSFVLDQIEAELVIVT